ncbi:unnamed protein product [Acanthoscelides obtectus]|uniref:Uncharacterized protein n=1 Tax=Acanthoscelides obtectus TaxID=200917 RepID=A0A9P0PUS2_ACAOB|nr:unnamed protein product [Acanthoscelides obtectus]CAK1653536.1 hypothetical protein AOBTE_LOCUS18280 [Acanthoscelides obtectus]
MHMDILYYNIFVCMKVQKLTTKLDGGWCDSLSQTL